MDPRRKRSYTEMQPSDYAKKTDPGLGKSSSMWDIDWDPEATQAPPRRGPGETQELPATAAQNQRIAEELKERMTKGEISPGNVELAALLGSQPAQVALGRRAHKGMSPVELIEFLLTDPNLKITINVG